MISAEITGRLNYQVHRRRSFMITATVARTYYVGRDSRRTNLRSIASRKKWPAISCVLRGESFYIIFLSLSLSFVCVCVHLWCTTYMVTWETTSTSEVRFFSFHIPRWIDNNVYHEERYELRKHSRNQRDAIYN